MCCPHRVSGSTGGTVGAKPAGDVQQARTQCVSGVRGRHASARFRGDYGSSTMDTAAKRAAHHRALGDDPVYCPKPRARPTTARVSVTRLPNRPSRALCSGRTLVRRRVRTGCFQRSGATAERILQRHRSDDLEGADMTHPAPNRYPDPNVHRSPMQMGPRCRGEPTIGPVAWTPPRAAWLVHGGLSQCPGTPRRVRRRIRGGGIDHPGEIVADAGRPRPGRSGCPWPSV